MRNIIVDTGPLVALFHARDKHHEPAKAVLESNPAALVSTWPVITEACHFLSQAGRHALLTFVRRGALRLEALSVEDVPQLDELLARYERMDFADATLVLIAEKTGITEIFTVDRRDFEVYRTRSGRRFRLLLA
ncbi:MAG: PIN domain-containing protein [Betaproteobacteria bacterium]|nr:MAG: PIN domain-containing protein [Betaproteobacteria bacterium]TMH57429.1 MAG: PIN domain-containing protein [Betaproteobacteria bacterium]